MAANTVSIVGNDSCTNAYLTLKIDNLITPASMIGLFSHEYL